MDEPPFGVSGFVHMGDPDKTSIYYLSKERKDIDSVVTAVVETYVENPVKPSGTKAFLSTATCGNFFIFPQAPVDTLGTIRLSTERFPQSTGDVEKFLNKNLSN